MKKNKRSHNQDEDGDYQVDEDGDDSDDEVDIVIDPKTKKRKQLFPDKKYQYKSEGRKAVLLIDQMNQQLMMQQNAMSDYQQQNYYQYQPQPPPVFQQRPIPPTELYPQDTRTTRNSHIFGFLETVNEDYVPGQFDLIQRGR